LLFREQSEIYFRRNSGYESQTIRGKFMSIELRTKAEELADKSRSLPNFKNLSLPGIKEQVAQILALIGRDGIFSTYTVHDVTHIDAMLSMLDWLVPESTRRVMTSVDWLLIVLAIYLHDLGMVTTSQEFERRLENAEFKTWRDGLDKTTEGREYTARANRMSSAEKERFFFQEYVRKGHAQRIREWVTGRHSRKWGSQVQPVAERMAELLSGLPSRFRDYLGTVCESHHSSDLENQDKYPLAARLGNDQAEITNVQYAAILLRTADLLHVTKDRTPSVMYQAIQFSDPKSVEEWDKQLGTFAVGPKGRKLLEGDPETAIIVINADFREERPLFSLQEYIAYADSEVKQSKRWIDKSRERVDAQDFAFPWHEVKGDVRLEGVPPKSLRFELDRGQLLDLLVGHTIYNDPTVAIRELLQNAIDAVRYQAHLAASEVGSKAKAVAQIGKVVVGWNPDSRQLVIEDSGTGMDRDIINHHLMSVGSSYYNTPQFEAEHGDFAPISRFGIGILTCFMVSDDVEIVTCKTSRGHRIKMTSVKSTYLLRELQSGDDLLRGIEPHGTRVTLRLRDTVDLVQRTVLDILRYWVILPECRVEYHEKGAPPRSVGFTSVADALASYRGAEEQGEWGASREETVVKKRINSNPAAGSETCELAFSVHAGDYPERSFVSTNRTNIPHVCIEGIRVSDQLPGFEDKQLSALLAVRGNRKFRTTVSRSGLEVDEEYGRVAILCTQMLFEHISDESNCSHRQCHPAVPWSQGDLLGPSPHAA
jgi:molecular chaperone HtpG